MTAEAEDVRTGFDCGAAELNLFFHKYAGQNQFRHHIGVTYVAVANEVIVGFVTVSPATLDADCVPGKKRLPQFPIPVLRVSRLAVHTTMQRKGIGKGLLRFSIELAEKMRYEYGCTGLLVDAKESSVRFYKTYGFVAVDAVEGLGSAIPRPVPMFLPLGSIPAAPST